MDSCEAVKQIVSEFFGDREVFLPRRWEDPEKPRGWGPWIIEANMSPEANPGDYDPPRRGTRKLRGGAKVYFAGIRWGGGERAIVVGRHRFSGEYLITAVKIEKLTSLRSL
jgi:hypothetical protein